MPENFILHVGVNASDKTVTLTDDRDALPPDITQYRTAEFVSRKDLDDKITAMELIGYRITLDMTGSFYETPVEEL